MRELPAAAGPASTPGSSRPSSKASRLPCCAASPPRHAPTSSSPPRASADFAPAIRSPSTSSCSARRPTSRPTSSSPWSAWPPPASASPRPLRPRPREGPGRDGSRLPLFADGRALAPGAAALSPPVTAPASAPPAPPSASSPPCASRARPRRHRRLPRAGLRHAPPHPRARLVPRPRRRGGLALPSPPRPGRRDRCTPHLTWHDQERYSNRQQTKMLFGGLLGTLDLEGDLSPSCPCCAPPRSSTSARGRRSGWGGSRSGRGAGHERRRR